MERRKGHECERGNDTRRAGDAIKSGSGMGESGDEGEPTENEIIETKIEAFLFYIYIYARGIFWTCLDVSFLKNHLRFLIVSYIIV